MLGVPSSPPGLKGTTLCAMTPLCRSIALAHHSPYFTLRFYSNLRVIIAGSTLTHHFSPEKNNTPHFFFPLFFSFCFFTTPHKPPFSFLSVSVKKQFFFSFFFFLLFFLLFSTMSDGFMLSQPAIPLSAQMYGSECSSTPSSQTLQMCSSSESLGDVAPLRRKTTTRRRKPLLCSLVKANEAAAPITEATRNPFEGRTEGRSRKLQLCREYFLSEDEKELSSAPSSTASSDDEDTVSIISTVSTVPLRSSFRLPREDSASSQDAPVKRIAFCESAVAATQVRPSRRARCTEGWVHALAMIDEEEQI